MGVVGGRNTTAQDVANYLVAHSDKMLYGCVSKVKLQKLLYYTQGFALALRGEPLFNEPIEAWSNGPVVREVWRRYQPEPYPIPPPTDFEIERYLPEDRELLNAILAAYGQIGPTRLSGMTHAEAPWSEAYNVRRNTPLAVTTMESYFSKLVEASRRGLRFKEHPILPVGSFRHQQRRQISNRMERHREKLRSIAPRRNTGVDSWADDAED